MIGGIFATLANFAINLVSDLGYPGIVLAMALENIFPPIPSEAIMPMAGYLTTTGRFNFFLTIGSGILGSLIGAVVLYYLGVWIGNLKLREFLSRYGKFFMTNGQDLDAAENWFNHHGEKSVFLARMVPIVRSIISIPAGFVRMPVKKFMLLTALGSFIWTAMETVVGIVLGRSWYLIGPWMKRFEFVVVGVFTTLTLYYFFKKFKSTKSQITNPK